MHKTKSYARRSPMAAVTIAAFILASVASGSVQLSAQAKPVVQHGAVELTSGLGRPLYALPDNPAIVAARANLARDPHNVSLVLKLSQAQAGQRQYREAAATCTKGIAFAPSNADLYLERGHRELGLRQFRSAMIDLEHAVQLDPKKLQANYHLALSHYFMGEFDEAAHYYKNALDLATTSDDIIDCSNWLYVSLRRAGKDDQAAQVLKRITPDIKNTEAHLYFYLQLLHFYQGSIAEQATIPSKPTDRTDVEKELAFDTTSYGVGNWYCYNHKPDQAKALFKTVVSGEAWNAWGFIGSETELVRMNKKVTASGL